MAQCHWAKTEERLYESAVLSSVLGIKNIKAGNTIYV